MFKRLIASLVCFTFIFSNLQYVHAQDFSINQLPVPGTMIGESAPFAPLVLKGLIVNPKKPLEFQFIVDTGKGLQDTGSIKEEANQLVKYFLAGLTIPEGDLWVNLSPYEKNRMVPAALGKTDLGRDLLAQDYILKQLTASLIYPEKDLGKEFWSRVYAKAQAQFGTTNVPVNTFNKVWILPDQAQVYENVNAAYVTKSTLKVMLDEDYTALQKYLLVHNSTDSIGSQIVREIVIPEITKEVNTGKNFAPLRQIYQALILAKWYKETIQNGLLDAVYTNKNKIAGVNLSDPAVKEQIYNRYLQAYKKGAFNYIKEDPMPDGQVVPRKYFSGGTLLKIEHLDKAPNDSAMLAKGWLAGTLLAVTLALASVANSALAQSNTPQTPSAQTQPASVQSIAQLQIPFIKDANSGQDPGVFNPEIFEQTEWNIWQSEGIQDEKLRLLADLNVFSNRRRETINKLIAMPQYYSDSLAPLARAMYGEWIHSSLEWTGEGERIYWNFTNHFDKTAIPYLVANLKNPYNMVSSGSSLALGYMGKDAVDAIPGLIEFISKNSRGGMPFSPGVRAQKALEQIIIDIKQNSSIPLDPELLKQAEKALVQKWYPLDKQEGSHFINEENLSILQVIGTLKLESSQSILLLREALKLGNEHTKLAASKAFVSIGHYSKADIPLIIDGLTYISNVRGGPDGDGHASDAIELIRLVNEAGSINEGLKLGLNNEDEEVRGLANDIIQTIWHQGMGDDIVGLLVETWDNKREIETHGILNENSGIENSLKEEKYNSIATKYILDQLNKSFNDSNFIEKNGNRMLLLQRINPDEFNKLQDRIFKEKKWPVIRNWSLAAGGLLAVLAGLGFVVKKLRDKKDAAMFTKLTMLKIGMMSDVNKITPYLNDADRDIRQVAMNRLKQIGANKEQIVNGYIAALSVDHYMARINAIEKLGDLADKGDKHVIESLLVMLEDANESVITSAEAALSKLGASKEQMVYGYYLALGLMYVLATVHPNDFFYFLSLRNVGARINAARKLGDLADKRDKNAIGELLHVLKDNNDNLRSSAEEALTKIGVSKEEMVKGYLAALSTGYPYVILNAVKKLGDLADKGDKHVIEPLREQLQDRENGIRLAAAESLRKLGVDTAMLQVQPHQDKAALAKVNPAANGGIDLNQINVLRNGKTVNVQFDQAQLSALEQGGFVGFTPVIINIQRISSPFQLLGINAPTKQVMLAKA